MQADFMTLKNGQVYPGGDGASGDCGKSRLFWKAQIVCVCLCVSVCVCVSVCLCERERETETERDIGQSRLKRAQSERSGLLEVPKPICQRLWNYPVFSLLLS